MVLFPFCVLVKRDLHSWGVPQNGVLKIEWRIIWPSWAKGLAATLEEFRPLLWLGGSEMARHEQLKVEYTWQTVFVMLDWVLAASRSVFLFAQVQRIE